MIKCTQYEKSGSLSILFLIPVANLKTKIHFRNYKTILRDFRCLILGYAFLLTKEMK